MFIGPKIVILLEKSLIASDIGWRIPQIPTLLGPIRNCLRLKIFRSNNVKKATLIKTDNKIKINSSKTKIRFIYIKYNTK